MSWLYFTVGVIFSWVSSALLVLSVAALLSRKRRRCLIASTSKLSWTVVATGLFIAVAYLVEAASAYYAGNPMERFAFINRVGGIYAWGYWLMLFGQIVAPQLFWFRRCRTVPPLSFAISLMIVGPTLVETVVKIVASKIVSS